MKHKYSEEIKTIPGCPPDCEPRSCLAYRFVFEDLTNEDNYKPPLVQNPKRRNSLDTYKICDGYALSFFDSTNQAKLFFKELKKSMKNIHISLGTHIAEVNITEKDGKCTRSDKKGHFSLHEYESTSFKGRFTIIGSAS